MAVPKRIVLGLGGLLVAVGLWCGIHAFYPGHYYPGTPLCLRLPPVSYEIPGTSRLIQWRARVHATRAAKLARWSLFGYGSEGTRFGLDWNCQVVDYQRDVVREENLPIWASDGVTGTVHLSCEHAGPSVTVEFAVAEMSCITDGPDYVYSRAYNQQMVRLRADNSI